MIPLVKRDAGTLLRDAWDLLAGRILTCPCVPQARPWRPYMRDARDLLEGHFVMCPYMRNARDLLSGRILTCPCVP